MARKPGRPARPNHIEPQLLEATENALLKLARDLNLLTGRHSDHRTDGSPTRPRPLELAVLAIKAQEALEVVARRQVALARQNDGLTWQEVGDAFDITMQSAHHRFAKPARIS